MRIAIIGAGASGVVCAYKAKNANNVVDVYEGNSDALKKLLLTGNGKCNYTNKNQSIIKYHTNNPELLTKIINEDNLYKVDKFTAEVGLVLKNKNDYCYPYSGSSLSVKAVFKNACLKKKVNFIYDTLVTDVVYKDNKFFINGNMYDKVVVATGSYAYPKTGSTGFGYEVAKRFGHTIIPVAPSLVQLVTNTALERDWAGIRCDVKVRYNNKVEEGELQFTNYGLSGICIFNLSRDIKLNLENKQKAIVNINFVAWYDGNDFKDYLNTRNNELKSHDITELCDGFIDYKLMRILLKAIKINPNKSWDELSSIEQASLVNVLQNYQVEIMDTKGFDSAQTCSGGVSLTEINLETLESLKRPGLYFCGEVIDIDGDCGGYNLTLAFLSGILVGEAIND